MKNRIFKVALVTVAAALLGLSGITNANAASKVSVDLPNEAVAGGIVSSIPITLEGFPYSVMTVSITVQSGTLTVVDSPSPALTLNPGFGSLSDQTELSFHGDTAAIVDILATGVTWTAPGDEASSSFLAIKILIGEFKTGSTYDPNTGHTYQFISEPLSWWDAKLAARTLTFEGKSGYLANITSAEENTFVAQKSGADSIWFGGTDDVNAVNAALTAASKPTLGYDPQEIGEYYWGDGPEAGTNFTTGLGGPNSVNGAFHSWAGGEPNNAGWEGCAVTNWGDRGMWNDLPCEQTHYYLVEFSTTQVEYETTVATFDNITGTDRDSNPGEVVEIADTGFDGMLILGFSLILVVAGAGATVLARKK